MMSNPAMVAALAASGLGAVGTIRQGQNAAKQAKLQAEITRRQAERSRQVAEARAAQIRRNRSREDAHLRARLLASGLDAGTGSALLALESRAGDAELNALSEINEGQYRAGLLDAKAEQTRFRGKLATRDAQFKATKSLLFGR